MPREQVGGSIGEVKRWEVVGGKWGTGWQGLEIDHHLCPTHWHLNLPWDIPPSLEMSELDRNCCSSAKWYHWSPPCNGFEEKRVSVIGRISRLVNVSISTTAGDVYLADSAQLTQATAEVYLLPSECNFNSMLTRREASTPRWQPRCTCLTLRRVNISAKSAK